MVPTRWNCRCCFFHNYYFLSRPPTFGLNSHQTTAARAVLGNRVQPTRLGITSILRIIPTLRGSERRRGLRSLLARLPACGPFARLVLHLMPRRWLSSALGRLPAHGDLSVGSSGGSPLPPATASGGRASGQAQRITTTARPSAGGWCRRGGGYRCQQAVAYGRSARLGQVAAGRVGGGPRGVPLTAPADLACSDQHSPARGGRTAVGRERAFKGRARA